MSSCGLPRQTAPAEAQGRGNRPWRHGRGMGATPCRASGDSCMRPGLCSCLWRLLPRLSMSLGTGNQSPPAKRVGQGCSSETLFSIENLGLWSPMDPIKFLHCLCTGCAQGLRGVRSAGGRAGTSSGGVGPSVPPTPTASRLKLQRVSATMPCSVTPILGYTRMLFVVLMWPL